jgi:hypothetical protein
MATIVIRQDTRFDQGFYLPHLATRSGTRQDDNGSIVRSIISPKQGGSILSPIHATISHGQIIPDTPVQLPDGTRVTVVLSEEQEQSNESEQLGMREEDWPTTPEGIAALLKQMDECPH